jgi:hypothetical protein
MKTLATIALMLAMISTASAQQATFRDSGTHTNSTAATTGGHPPAPPAPPTRANHNFGGWPLRESSGQTCGIGTICGRRH